MSNDIKEAIVVLPCAPSEAEALGSSADWTSPVFLDFTGADLCQNTMFVGTVGSGKTTSMNAMVQQLIEHRSREPEHKMGLFIYDSKMDETRQKIVEWATEAGRSDDIMVIAPEGEYYYELFPEINTLTELEQLITKFLSGSVSDLRDGYWNETRRTLLTMGLVVAMFNGDLEFEATLKTLQTIIMCDTGEEAEQLFKNYKLVRDSIWPTLHAYERNILNQVSATIEMWTHLDHRTKSNHASIFANNLQPLIHSQAQNYFLPLNMLGTKTRKPVNIPKVVDEGKILIVSVNAVQHPELASLLGRLIKADMYDKAQSRQLAYNNEGRLVGLIFDEYPLVVTGKEGHYGDIQQLQSLRSKRTFVVAATQGLKSLDLVIGNEERLGLTLNFNNWFLMSSNESEVKQFAASLLLTGVTEFSDIKPSALKVNQAYVALARQRVYPKPLWLKPLFFEGQILPESPDLKDKFSKRLTAARIEVALVNSIEKRREEQPPTPVAPHPSASQRVITNPIGIPAEEPEEEPEDNTGTDVPVNLPSRAETLATIEQYLKDAENFSDLVASQNADPFRGTKFDTSHEVTETKDAPPVSPVVGVPPVATTPLICKPASSEENTQLISRRKETNTSKPTPNIFDRFDNFIGRVIKSALSTVRQDIIEVALPKLKPQAATQEVSVELGVHLPPTMVSRGID